MYRKGLIDFLNSVAKSYTDLEIIAGDASFRKYYRIKHNGDSYILMDAPPPHENAELFTYIASAFMQAGLNIPDIIESDLDNGFLLLSDFGDVQLLDELKLGNKKVLKLALDELLLLQIQGGQNIFELPDFSIDIFEQEFNLFTEWFIPKLIKTELSIQELDLLKELNITLTNNAITQKQVWVHKDFHSRNLMLINNRIGVIDFQDAVLGPVTYDLVSILKDCYIKYSDDEIERYLEKFYIQLVSHEIINCSFDDFERNFDYMGLQRHIKVAGIFSRLSIRDKKDSYLEDLPLVFNYITDVITKYPELHKYQNLFLKLNKQLKQLNIAKEYE